VLRGATIKSIKDGMRLTSDAFLARCMAADASSYINVHAAVVPTEKVRPGIIILTPDKTTSDSIRSM